MCASKQNKLAAAFLAVATLSVCLIAVLHWATSKSVIVEKEKPLHESSLHVFESRIGHAAAAAAAAVREGLSARASMASDATLPAAERVSRRFSKCPPSSSKKPELRAVRSGQIAFPSSTDGKDSVFLYSAHYDDRQHKVMLITDQMAEEHGPRHCQLWFSTYDDPYPSAAVLYHAMFPGGNRAKRLNYIYSCALPVDQDVSEAPFAVGLVFGAGDQCAQLLRIAKVEHSVGDPANMTEFGVCVSPFSKKYGDVVRLIEFIEVNMIFGAQKFIFFNYSTSPNLEPVLRSYIAAGVVDVIPFPLYPGAEQLLPYYAQTAAFHDCVYRYLNTVRFFAMLDLDEFIVPRIESGTGTWHDLLHQAGTAASYVNIRNTFYKLEWPDAGPYSDGGNMSLKARGLPRLCTLQKVWRERLIWRHGERSKYIVRTRDVEQLLVHTAVVASDRQWLVPESVALVQHYRDWEDVDSPDDVRRKGVYDDYLLQYGEAIVRRIQNRISRL